MDVLPHWERGTPAVLCVAGPHPIPVSTGVRAGDRRILLALGSRRETLERLRREPGAAFCLMGRGVAFTAHGTTAVGEQLQVAPSVVVVEVRVERLQDHLADGRTEMRDGARWRWREERYADSDEAIFAELDRLAR